MKLISAQAPRAAIMIRPHHFHPNPETAEDNAFQTDDETLSACELAERAHAEVTRAAARLQDAGVAIHIFEDESRETPDSVFPNNWLSTHVGGHVALYPMFKPSRRRERRPDIVEFLKHHYRVQDVIDYSGLEEDGIALEGTGSMVLDHIGRVAYAARSNRTNEVALERFCTHFNFEPMVFDAADAQGRLIYHTNVLMCVGTGVALVVLEAIRNPARRAEVRQRLMESGRDVIDLSFAQMEEFAGNAIELAGRDGPLLTLSSRALAALTATQRATIEQLAMLLPLEVPTVELAGGSVRCMIAGIHLTPRLA